MKAVILILIYLITIFKVFSSQTILEENDSIVLDGVSVCKVFQNDLYIINHSNNLIVKYDLNTGKVLSSFKTFLGLNDSLALSGKIPYKHKGLDYKFVTLDYFSNIIKKDIKKTSSVQNYLDDILEINENEIILAGDIIGYKVDNNNASNTSLENRHSVFIFNNNFELKKVICTEVHNFLFTRKIYKYSKDNIWIVPYQDMNQEIRIDSLPTLSLYDGNGFFQKNILYLDEFNQKNNFRYSFPYLPIISFKNDSIIHSSSYIEKVYLSNYDTLYIKNLPNKNSVIFNDIVNNYKGDISKYDLTKFYNRLDEIKVNKDYIYLKIRLIDDNKKYSFLYQKYNYYNKQLINEVKVDAYNEQFECSTFSEDFKKIYVLFYDKLNENFYIKDFDI